MSVSVQNIPKHLIYEMVDGVPIYYKGYRDYLDDAEQSDETPASGLLQSALTALIATRLNLLLAKHYGKKYLVLGNELGILFKKKSWRAADVGIVEHDKAKKLLKELNNEYIKTPPKIVVGIDTKADLSELENSFGYYQKKTKELLDFGVERVIWIYTDTQTVMLAEQGQPWQLQAWTESFEVLENVVLNVSELMKELAGE